MIMKEELNVKDERSVLVPFLVGGFIGAGIALLLAPKSGMALRKDIKDIASDTRDRIATTVEKGKGLYAEGTAAVKNAIATGDQPHADPDGELVDRRAHLHGLHRHAGQCVCLQFSKGFASMQSAPDHAVLAGQRPSRHPGDHHGAEFYGHVSGAG
jgi:hypothetical protein